MKEEVIQLEASTGDDRVTLGTATIHKFTKDERLLRAVKKLGLFWLIAVFCVFLPVVHFFLVPLFLILGVFLCRRVLKTDGEVLSGKILCPACASEVTLGRELLSWPLKEICQGCARVLRMHEKK